MHILHVINSLSGGGAENFVVNLSIAMNKNEKVTILNYSGVLDNVGGKLKRKLLKNGVNLISLNIKNNYLKVAIPFILSYYIRRINPDVIHAHLDQSEFFVALSRIIFSTRKKRIYVRTLHNTEISRFFNLKYQKIVASKFDGTIACSTAVYMADKFKFYHFKNFEIIEYGIVISDITTNNESLTQYRRKLSIPDDKFVLLHIGSFTPRAKVLQKAQDLIIKSLVHLNKYPNICIIFLGDGIKRLEIESLAASLNVADKCEFKGMVENVFEYIYASNALLMPSRFEGLPIAGIECVCAKLPIIVSNIPAFKDIALENSVVCNQNTSASIANGIDRCIHDYENKKTKAISLSKNFMVKFDINKVAKQYLSYYTKVIKKSLIV